MTAVEKLFVNRTARGRVLAERAMKLLGRVDYKAGWTYLDVGCGVGFAAKSIASATDLDVTGVDLDPRQIEAAKAGASRQNLHFKVMDATTLDFRDGEFDIVATSMATHHIPGWERALGEMARVVRPGGYLIYTDLAFPPWLAKIGRRILPFVGLPSEPVVNSVAASSGLAPVYEARSTLRLHAIWRKPVPAG